MVREMPEAPKFKDILGPSFILLGLGLGSGELILWPYISSKFGLGLLWMAIVGITLQFFMNMEIERYSLARGESIFVGFAKLSKILPFWFIVSTIIPWMWPGIIASSAVALGGIFGVQNINLLSVALLLFIGIVLTLGPILYKTQEFFQKIIIFVGTPFILILAFFIGKSTDLVALVPTLPIGIPIATLFAAIAYSGAGGNLNLAQSFYIKEKGYGMGKYAGRITSILTGKREEMNIEGVKFEKNETELKRFKDWWRLINLEHGIVFWFLGTLTIILLSFLAYSTVFGREVGSDIGFIFTEAMTLGGKTHPFIGKAFLAVAGLMLFSTQLGILDTTSRILTENLTLISKKYFPTSSIGRNFYIFLWGQIALSICVILFGFTQPLTLLVLAAILNAVAMFIHIGLTLILNMTKLDKEIRPSIFRISAMVFAFIFFGIFVVNVIGSYI